MAGASGGRFPNAATLGAGMLGIVVVGVLDLDPNTHLFGFVLGGAAFLTMYSTDWLGGGSVKLGMAMTVIAGWFTGALFVALFAAFFGGAYLVRRALRRPDTIVPGAPVLLTAVLCAEAAAPFLRPLL
jgi:Flp pilus assembly protein protease CpaA